MSGAKSVRKGKVTERRVAVELRRVFPDAKRALQYQREHGAGDVEAGPLWVEVKSYDVPTVRTWRKAEAERKKSGRRKRVWTALVQPSGGTGPQLITLPLKALVGLLSGAEDQAKTRRALTSALGLDEHATLSDMIATARRLKSAEGGSLSVKAKRGRKVTLPFDAEMRRIGLG